MKIEYAGWDTRPEGKAYQLGGKLAADAFNSLDSLDARLCQELGRAFGEQIAELMKLGGVGK